MGPRCKQSLNIIDYMQFIGKMEIPLVKLPFYQNNRSCPKTKSCIWTILSTPFWFLAQGRSRPDFFFLSLDSSQKLTKTVKRITVLNVNFASLITLYTLRKKSKQIKILRFFPRKLIKYQTQIYRIVFQCKFLESDNFYFFGFRLKTSQLLFQAMPARAVIWTRKVP